MSGELWIFGYGSLMWRPDFAHEAAVRATLKGYRRGFYVRTVHHRGTRETPGLVLGVKPSPGDDCVGRAYRVAAAEAEGVRAYLAERELRWYPVYREAEVRVETDSGAVLAAQTYLPDPAHEDFLGDLTPAAAAALIREAHGVSGANVAYVRSTVDHLRELGIEDRDVMAVAEALNIAAPKPR